MSGDSVITNGHSNTTDACRKQIQRHVNCLGDDSKITRKRGLIDLRKETIGKQLGATLLQDLASTFLKPTLKCLADSSEINRELAVTFIADFISIIPSPEETLQYIIPTLVQRLGQQEIVETSEELRLSVLESVLLPCVELSGKRIAGFLDELIQILQRTIVDPFAEVRKCSCKIAAKVARTIPEYFHMQSESLINPLMLTITHQHSKVRIAVIEATADVIQFGNGKSVDDVIAHVAQRFFDPSAQVRMCVTRMIGRWLLELPDRYSFFYKFIPLILTSFNDEMPDIRKEARRLWNEAGLLYQQENEQDLKDKLDFSQPLPVLYPQNEERPWLGCRELVQRNLSKLMPAIINDLSDWVSETRVATSQLLYELLLHAEDYTTQHMQPLVQALMKACADEQVVVVKSALRCCNLIGAFVKPEIFCKLLLQNVQLHLGSAPPLQILGATVRGCSNDVLGDKLPDIVHILSSPDVCQASEKSGIHHSLLDCVEAILTTCIERAELFSLQLFTVIITVMALANEEPVFIKCDELLGKLSTTLKISEEELYACHTKQVLDSMQGSYESWNTYSVEQRVFDALLSRAGSVVGEVLNEIIPMLKANLQPEKDPELKLSFFKLLTKLLLNADKTFDSTQKFSPEFVEGMIRDMIVPNLVWKAGRTTAAVRTIAMATFWSLLRSGLVIKATACSVLPSILPQICSCLDDDVKTTRLTTAKVITRLLYICEQDLGLDEVLHKLYMELLKRMDDSSDEIRVTITKTWGQFFKSFKPGYDEQLYKAHLEAMYGGLLVHMDDPETNIQIAVQDVLKVGGVLSPTILCREIEKVKHKHRTQAYCNQLIEHFTNS
uniref:HEAT repeat-containing protein 2 n=1 Tax=Phallusia mammillata TaxID=59560 RepID=A0A6F9DF89_9ASCI|nr:HEAT repeat-containing protein 2 [Phallusia mammillata]